MLAKSARYFSDMDAVREDPKPWNEGRMSAPALSGSARETNSDGYKQRTVQYEEVKGANRRNVWTIGSEPYADAHFATFPIELPSRCIRIGSRPGDVVLDPFAGSGTTFQAAEAIGRRWTGYELNPEYHALIAERTRQAGLFS
jgi:site-specific DNA-methyltransferase (cytosine-N4-specific)